MSIQTPLDGIGMKKGVKGNGKKLIIYQNGFPKGEFDVMYGFADLTTTNLIEMVQFLQIIDRKKVVT